VEGVAGVVRTVEGVAGVVWTEEGVAGVVRTVEGVAGVVRTVQGVEGVVRTVEGVAGVVGSLGQGVVAGGLREADLLLQGPLTPAHALRQQHAVTLAHAVHLPALDTLQQKLTGGFLGFFCSVYCIQHCFICRPSDSTVSVDAGIESKDCCDFGIGSQPL
jgi:hypothetical protein